MAGTLADGQLGATATPVWSGSGATATRQIILIASNTGGGLQAITLTFSRGGGTPRRIAYVELNQNEALRLSGVSVNPADALYAVTTSAGFVDYLVAEDDGSGDAFNLQVYDATGVQKSSSDQLNLLAEMLS